MFEHRRSLLVLDEHRVVLYLHVLELGHEVFGIGLQLRVLLFEHLLGRGYQLGIALDVAHLADILGEEECQRDNDKYEYDKRYAVARSRTAAALVVVAIVVIVVAAPRLLCGRAGILCISAVGSTWVG